MVGDNETSQSQATNDAHCNTGAHDHGENNLNNIPVTGSYVEPNNCQAQCSLPTTKFIPTPFHFPAPTSVPTPFRYPTPSTFPAPNYFWDPIYYAIATNYPTAVDYAIAINYLPPPNIYLQRTNCPRAQLLPQAWCPHAPTAHAINLANSINQGFSNIVPCQINQAPLNRIYYNPYVSEDYLNDCLEIYDPNELQTPLDNTIIESLNLMISRVMSMKHADLFFKMQFTKNYFPEFVEEHKDDFIDVRSIVLKCEVGGYRHVSEIIHDMKNIVYTGKEFLKRNIDVKLHTALCAFEFELHALLSDPFDQFAFDYILCDPNQVMYSGFFT